MLNQHLLNPIRPTTLAIKIKKKAKRKEDSIIPRNIKISDENFNVPGKPEYNIFIKSIDTPRLGVICKIPEISDTFLELNLFCTQSTIKNINVDNAVCVIQNKNPPYRDKLDPQQNAKYIKFIS